MNHTCSPKAREIHREMYNCFMNKVKDKNEIIYNDYMKIVDEIIEERPEFENYFFDAVLGKYGWRKLYKEEDKNLYMIRLDCYSNVEISSDIASEEARSFDENFKKYYDIIYDLFMNRVNGRQKIPSKEYNYIINEISEIFPKVAWNVIIAIIQRHRWRLNYEWGDDDDFPHFRSPEGWVYSKW